MCLVSANFVYHLPFASSTSMAYRRKFGNSNKEYSIKGVKRSFPKRRRKVRTLNGKAKQAYRIAKYNSASVERKISNYALVSAANLSWNTSGVLPMFSLNQGNADGARRGDAVRYRFLSMKFATNFANTTLGINALVRLIVIWDYSNTILQPAQILANYGMDLMDVLAPLNRDYSKQYAVIGDYYFPLSMYNSRMVMSINKPLNYGVSRFIAGTNNATSGVIKYMALSNIDPTTGGHLPSFTFMGRVYYTDS